MKLAGLAALVAAASLASVLGAQTRSDEWRSYGQNVQGWRYSELKQVDAQNVARLSLAVADFVALCRAKDVPPDAIVTRFEAFLAAYSAQACSSVVRRRSDVQSA